MKNSLQNLKVLLNQARVISAKIQECAAMDPNAEHSRLMKHLSQAMENIMAAGNEVARAQRQLKSSDTDIAVKPCRGMHQAATSAWKIKGG